MSLQLRQPRLVVDGHGRAVVDGALDVVDVDVVAEDLLGADVGRLDRGSGEADERGVGQRVADVLGEAVADGRLVLALDQPGFEAVLAAVGFVGDENDVAPLREQREFIPVFFGHELLDGREDDSPTGDLEQVFEVGAAGGLLRGLAQEFLPAREDVEQLIVEVVAVGQHDQRRVRQRRMLNDLAGVEQHRQALAAALRVPDHPDAAVALDPGRRDGVIHRLVDGVILVIGGDLLGDGCAVGLEDDEIADQVEQALRREDALDQRLKLGLTGRIDDLAIDRAPRLEPLPAAGERAEPRLDAIRDDQQRVVGEQRRDVVQVGLQLVESAVDGGVLVGGVLEFEQRQRQPVDEQQHVRAAVGLGARGQVDVGDGELVDRQPVVGARIGEIDQPDFVVLELPAVAVGDVDAFGEQAVKGVIVDQRVLAFGSADAADGFVDRARASGGRDVGVDAIQRRPQPTEQQHLAVVGALGGGFTRRDVAAEDDAVAEFV